VIRQSTEHIEATSNNEQTATDDARGLAGTMVVFGLLGLIPPFTPLGIGLIIIGGIVLALSPVAEAAEQQMVETTTRQVAEGSGNGCGSFLVACLVVIAIVGLAFMVAVAATVGI
jgi:hypothetical protein